MRIGIIVFAYNRSTHLTRTLEALKKNDGVDKLYIFHDGLRCEADREEWNKTRIIIENITWCETKVHISTENRGLANSIVFGINAVMEENDAVIVLEDDCIPQPAFVSYMRQCFEKYQFEKKVYSISGYSWPIDSQRGESDIYFCGRPCSWGWGTWKDRWLEYKRDYNIISDIKNDKEASRRLAMWGDDLESMLVSNIRGITNSWYVFWALLLIKKNGYAINPYETLIQNEGFDGTGVHCKKTDRFSTSVFTERSAKNEFKLPERIEIDPQIIKGFRKFYGVYLGGKGSENKSSVLVYGSGYYYKHNAKKINDIYNIESFVDTYKKDKYYAGIEIISPNQILEKEFQYIIVMIENETTRLEIRKELIETYGVEAKKIKLGWDV